MGHLCGKLSAASQRTHWWAGFASLATMLLGLLVFPMPLLAAPEGIPGKLLVVLPQENDGSSGDLIIGDGNGNRRTVFPGRGLNIHNPVWSPDGSSLAFLVASRSNLPDRQDDVYVAPAIGGSPRRILRGTQPLSGLTWFPDGKRLLLTTGFNLPGTRLNVLDMQGQLSPLPVLGGDPASIGQAEAAISPDSSRIAYWQVGLDFHSAIVLAQADGSDPQELLDVSGEGVSHPTWRPDGTAIAVVVHNNLIELPLDGSDPRTLHDNVWTGSPIAYSRDGTAVAFFGNRDDLPTYGTGSAALYLQTMTVDGTQIGAAPNGTDYPEKLVWADGALFFGSTFLKGPGVDIVRPDGTAQSLVYWLSNIDAFDWHP